MQSVINFGILVVVLLAGFWVLSRAIESESPPAKQPGGATPTNTAVTRPEVTKKMEPEVQVVTPPTPPVAPEKKVATTVQDPPPVEPAKKEEDGDAVALAELNKAIEARDKAIQSGNFAGARLAMEAFTKQYTQGEPAQRGREELDETNRMIDEALNAMLQEAERAMKAKRYRQAAAYSTRVISADPGGRAASEASKLMNHIDTTAEARFKEIMEATDKELGRHKLNDAMMKLSIGLDDLGGTKWAEQLNARQYRLALANKFLVDCEAARAKAQATKKGTWYPAKLRMNPASTGTAMAVAWAMVTPMARLGARS